MRRAQPFAPAIHNIVAQLINQLDLRVQLFLDKLINALHIIRDEAPQFIDMGTGVYTGSGLCSLHDS